MAHIEFGHLGIDEGARRAVHHLGAETLLELAVELSVAVDQARIEQGRAHGDVGAHLDALVDGAGRVPDLEAEIPQNVEHVLGDALAPRRLLVGKQEQQVDVGAGRQQRAAVAAGGDDRHALGVRRIGRPVDVRHRVVVEDADQLVLEVRQPGGATAPAVVCFELAAGRGTRIGDQRLQALDHGAARFGGIIAVGAEIRRQLRAQLASVEIGRGLLDRCIHAAG